MARFPDLGSLPNVDEREKVMRAIIDEAIEFRQKTGVETEWIEVHQMIRGRKDPTSAYASQLRHPYAFAAGTAVHAALYPAFLSADPPFQIEDTNPENKERNEFQERIITAQLRNPDRSNFRLAWDWLLLDLSFFGTAVPWMFFKSQHRRVGPIYEPVKTFDEEQAFDDRGRPLVEERYENLRTYHAPWIEKFDLWDYWAHPAGTLHIGLRDTTGRELLAQSQGDNPIYDPERVNRMLSIEARAVMGARERGRPASDHTMFSTGDVSITERDALAISVGSAPAHQEQFLSLQALRDVEGKPYPIYHVTNDQYTMSYAVSSIGRLFELRFSRAASIDGTPNFVPMVAHRSPQELYGVSSLTVEKPLLKAQEAFYRAGMDGAALTLDPMWGISSAMKAMNPRMTTGPGYMLTFPNDGQGPEKHFKRLDMPQAWVQTMNFLDYIKRDLDMGGAQSDFQRGKFPEGKKTAFLSNLVAQGAEGRLKMMHERISNQWGVRMLKKMAALNAMHLRGSDYARYLGPEAVKYTPPSLREIVEDLSFVPKGSLENSNQAIRAGRWPEILTALVRDLPFLKLRPINEAYRRWFEDMGISSIVHLLPTPDDTIDTEYIELTQGVGRGSAPKSPTDFSQEMAGAMGATAPPGPQDGGGDGVNRFGAGA